MTACDDCGAWRRTDESPAEELCGACGAVLDPAKAHPCRTPTAFRTDFRPQPLDADEMASGRYRSICAEGRAVRFGDARGGNLRVVSQQRERTYRLNRGPQTGDDPRGAGFDATPGEQALGSTQLPGQYLARPAGGDVPEVDRFTPDAAGEELTGFWLAAPKTTDALFLAPRRVRPGLRSHQVRGGSAGAIAVRAAALSATYMFVTRAADRLDLDPEEFDIIEPRPHVLDGGRVPLLQITDHLVNGAGFCERLARPEPGGASLAASLVRSMVRDPAAEPMRSYLAPVPNTRTTHPEACDQACYLCLHRYGNQMYHGLLDWRLGLCFLAAMDDDSFDCGLGGDFGSAPPYLADWPLLAERAARQMVRRFGKQGEARRAGRLWAFRLDSGLDWALVVHPLWDTDQLGKEDIVGEAMAALPGKVLMVDTFRLARQPILVRDELKRGWQE